MASRFWVGGTGTWDASDTTHWSASDGGAGGASVPGSSDTVTLNANSGGGTVTMSASLNPTVTSITCGAFTGTFDTNSNTIGITTFSGSGSGARTFSFGGSTFNVSGSGVTIWTIATITNLTWTAPATINFTYSGSVGTRTFTGGTLTYGAINVTAGTDTFTLANINEYGNFSFSGFSGTWSGATQQRWNGSLTLNNPMNVTYTGAMTFNGTSGTQILTSAGNTWGSAITVNNAGSTLQFFDAFSTTGNFTFTAGAIDTNGKAITTAVLSASNTNTKTLTISSLWTVTGSGNAWNFSAATSGDTTVTGTGGTAEITDATASAKTISMGTVNWGTMAITFSGSGSGAYTFSGAATNIGAVTVSNTGVAGFTHTGANKSIASLTFTNYTGQVTMTSNLTVTGSITESGGMTFTGAGIFTLSPTSGTAIITSNSVAGPSLTINAPGATIQLADNFSSLGGTTGIITLTAGTFDTNGKTINTQSYVSTGATTRVFTCTNSTINLSGTGTIFNLATAGNTVNATGSTINVTDTSITTKTFNPQNFTWGTLNVSAGTGIFQMHANANTTTFSDVTLGVGLPVKFFAGSTTNITTATANESTFSSTTGGSAWNIVCSIGTILWTRVSLQDSVASGGATFIAKNSTNVSGNSGWIFSNGNNNIVEGISAGGMVIADDRISF